jgi:hypothetical protein
MLAAKKRPLRAGFALPAAQIRPRIHEAIP